MAFDAYLKFIEPRVTGEVTLRDKYKPDGPDTGLSGWIDLEEYGFAASMAVSPSRSSGTGAATTGKGKLEPFTFKKFVDATSMSLAFHAAAGTVFKQISVNLFASLTAPDGSAHDPFLFLSITMKGAVIGSCKLSGGGGDDLPTEDIEINYGTINYKCWPFTADAETGAISKQTAVDFDWNTITNSGRK